MILMLMVFAVLLCYLNSSETKAGKFVARTGLEPWGLFLESPETFRAYFGFRDFRETGP